MKFMLDTNVLMHVANKEPGYRNISKQLSKHDAGDVVLSVITAHELHYKIQKQRIGKARLDTLADLM